MTRLNLNCCDLLWLKFRRKKVKTKSSTIVLSLIYFGFDGKVNYFIFAAHSLPFNHSGKCVLQGLEGFQILPVRHVIPIRKVWIVVDVQKPEIMTVRPIMSFQSTPHIPPVGKKMAQYYERNKIFFSLNRSGCAKAKNNDGPAYYVVPIHAVHASCRKKKMAQYYERNKGFLLLKFHIATV